MKELNLQEIQKIELNLLKEVDRICRDQGFRYFMVGGTLIGAVRHQGFIPWDDDIDISMPRPDYEAFIQYCMTNQTEFRLLSNRNTENYWNLFSKVSDPRTKIIDSVIDGQDHDAGVSIDIFPIDGLGMTLDEARRTFMKTELKRDILDARNWKRFSRSKTHGLAYEPIRLAMFLLSRLCSPSGLMKKIEAFSRRKSFDSQEYSACIAGAYRTKEIMEKRIYSDYCQLQFQGEQFMAPEHYDEFLTAIYGNYMELPPEDKRVTHHTYKAYLLD